MGMFFIANFPANGNRRTRRRHARGEKKMIQKNIETRSIPAELETRSAEDQKLFIEGYFAVYDSVYQMASDMSESIAQGAFTNSIGGDIRALINHDTTLVMGRTAAHTLELREDAHGVWGRIEVNPKDTDAMNAYARVERGDVSQCSIGFNIITEETDFRDDGSVHWTIREADLAEVSICTFPAYEETNVSARAKERDEIIRKKNEAWRTLMQKKLKGES